MLLERKHSPGPWIAKEFLSGWRILDKYGNTVASRIKSGRDGGKTDALFMAANSDMLDALEATYNFLLGKGLAYTPFFKQIEATLKKATGLEKLPD